MSKAASAPPYAAPPPYAPPSYSETFGGVNPQAPLSPQPPPTFQPQGKVQIFKFISY